MRCTTCNRPANDRYTNAAAGEVCVDRSHDPYLTVAQRLYAETQREAIASRSGTARAIVAGLVPAKADLEILEAFDASRRVAGHDYGAGQRARELQRLRRELASKARGRLVDENEIRPTDVDLAEAFQRIAAPRVARITREDYRRSTPATRRTLETWKRLERSYVQEGGQEAEEFPRELNIGQGVVVELEPELYETDRIPVEREPIREHNAAVQEHYAEFRRQTRETLRGMSDQAIAYQVAHGSRGGIAREEIELEARRRGTLTRD